MHTRIQQVSAFNAAGGVKRRNHLGECMYTVSDFVSEFCLKIYNKYSSHCKYRLGENVIFRFMGYNLQ